MSFFPVYLFLISVLVVVGVVNLLARARRRRGSLRVRHYAFPPGWLKFLEGNVPFYRRMPVEFRVEFQDEILNFIDSRKWKACGGLEAVTDEMKVTIAANASLLSFNRTGEENFARVLCVLVFPVSATPEDSAPPPGGWPPGSVGVIWDGARKTVRDWRDPEMRGLLEVTARLGVEPKPDSAEEGRYYTWGRILGSDLSRSAEEKKTESSPDEIPARLLEESEPQAPAEFLGGVTELFFRAPDRLQTRHPGLYRLLLGFYRLDPVRWRPAAR